MTQDDLAFTTGYLDDLRHVIGELDAGAIATAIDWMRQARDADATIYICGNGGSASIASQMVVDIVKGASLRKQARFRMVGLTDSIATITAYANDEGYETVFEEPLKNFARAGDLVIGISGSGNSENVLRAIRYANLSGCRTIALTSGESGQLRDEAQLALAVLSSHMGRLEDCFFIMTHVLCYAFIEDD
ncbi:MAG: SIS domain-containing protein [Planctomycetaceae bacterium]|jgi:D-sedoheptulose 7-phosphate isomerase|nr:SIS domain-containing protein [Planctomycetaceae bacterium]